jgi:hypothetical protein
MAQASSTVAPSPRINNILYFMRRVLPSTFRSATAQVEITNPLPTPSWVPATPWLVDNRGSVFVRLS